MLANKARAESKLLYFDENILILFSLKRNSSPKNEIC